MIIWRACSGISATLGLWLSLAAVMSVQAAPAAGDTVTIHGIRMVYIPAGSFQMGTTDGEDPELLNSRPLHKVNLDGFWMSATEITQEQYNSVMDANPSLFMDDSLRPVDQVSWYDAVDFCNALSRLTGFEHCYRLASRACYFDKNGFRLPTEAEWEYACRAGSEARYYTGERESDLARAGWYDVNSAGTTHRVGLKEPNSWGLFDMHGNLWEWCNDWMGAYTSKEATDPTGPRTGNSKVLRGGAWHYYADGCASNYRHRAEPHFRLSMVGFRVVRRDPIPPAGAAEKPNN